MRRVRFTENEMSEIVKVKGIVIALVAAMAVASAMLFGMFSIRSSAIALEEKVTEAQSAIKVQEKRRADLLPNLAEAVKAYDKHEYETLVHVVSSRMQEDGGITDETQNEIHQIVSAVIEEYPELYSQKNYQEYMKESSITENKIMEARNSYNKAVSRYNTYCRNTWNVAFLSLLGYEQIEFKKLDYNVSEDAPTNLF